MGVVVTFNYANWIALFPEFTTTVSQPQAEQVLLPLASGFNRNDGGGPVRTAEQQTNLLNLMMAHLGQMFYGSVTVGSAQGGQAGQIVGRISSATQGSVSVSTEMPSNPNAAWYNQTKYGAAYWQIAAPYRTMRYLPKFGRAFNAWPGQGGGFRGR